MVRLSWTFLICSWLAFAQEHAGLPVKRVVLFKNGVGYFEHVGTVRGNEAVTISFTSGQLNDVLKSLTVLDLNGGRIAGVAYGTTAPVERQLGDLHLPWGEKTTLADFLGALRGTRLGVKSGTTEITGRLLSIERKTRISGGTTLEVDYLSLISDTGELRTTELGPSFSVRLLEPGLPGKVDRFLDLVSSGREADVRQMVVSTEGSGERSLYVSYISEVPVWKSTYRIVLNKAGQNPLLQGWAIVDNTVGEDWDNVELSLVAGAPQSFIQNLSQPYYTQRPVVSMPENVSVSPQTHESTLIPGEALVTGVVTDPSGAAVGGADVKAFDANGNLAAQTTTDSTGAYEIASLPNGMARLEVHAPGFNRTSTQGIAITGTPVRQDVRLSVGASTETVTVAASAATIQTESADVAGMPINGRNTGRGGSLGSGAGLGMARKAPPSGYGAGSGGGVGGGVYNIDTIRARAQAAALSQALGDLFEYKLKEPITIRKNRSALVPIAQATITAEKVSIWNEQIGLPRPQRALWLTNTTGLTLDGGSVSILEDETFAGEGVIDPLRPGEKRLVSYATDLAVNADAHSGSEPQRISRVRISRGMMTQESEIREKKTYTFRNEDSAARTIIVEHPVRQGYQLRGTAQPVETTASWMRFRLDVAPKQTASLVVEESRPSHSTFALTNINSDQVALFVKERSIDPAIEAALRDILARQSAMARLDAQKSGLDDQSQAIFDDQQRLRENIKALKGTPEEKPLLQRYTQQLNEQETQLEQLRKQTSDLDAQIDAAKAALDGTIQQLSFDVAL